MQDLANDFFYRIEFPIRAIIHKQLQPTGKHRPSNIQSNTFLENFEALVKEQNHQLMQKIKIAAREKTKHKHSKQLLHKVECHEHMQIEQKILTTESQDK